MATKEVWKDVPGEFFRFRVSNQGRVMRFNNRTGRWSILKSRTKNHGYPVIQHEDLVHRLVAVGFFGLIPSGCVVNHKDGDKSRPVPDNLEFVSKGENIRHAYRLGLLRPLKGQDHPQSRIADAQVILLRQEWASGEFTQKQLAAKYMISQASVSDIVRGKSKTHLPVAL